MQSINILGAEEESGVRTLALQFCQGLVGGIGRGIPRPRAALRIVLPDKLRSTRPHINIGQFIMAATTPVCALKYGYPALRADSCAGKNEDFGRRGHRLWFPLIARSWLSNSL